MESIETLSEIDFEELAGAVGKLVDEGAAVVEVVAAVEVAVVDFAVACFAGKGKAAAVGHLGKVAALDVLP